MAVMSVRCSRMALVARSLRLWLRDGRARVGRHEKMYQFITTIPSSYRPRLGERQLARNHHLELAVLQLSLRRYQMPPRLDDTVAALVPSSDDALGERPICR